MDVFTQIKSLAQCFRLRSMLSVVVVLLLISATNALPLSERSPLNRSELQILQRAIENELAAEALADSDSLRVRRKATEDKRAELLAYDKKSYPRICYFSPIQCLFTRNILRR